MKMKEAKKAPLTNPSPYLTALADMRRKMGYFFVVLSAGFMILAIFSAIKSGGFDLPIYLIAGTGLLCFAFAISRFHDARETLKASFPDNPNA